MTCSHYSKVDAVKTTIERNLVTKKREIADDKDDKGVTITSTLREVLADSGCLKPPGEDHKLIVYLEDIHMTAVDKYGDIPGAEVFRDLLTIGEWYSEQKKGRRVIEDTNLVACIDQNAEQILKVPRRLLYNFSLIGLEGFSS